MMDAVEYNTEARRMCESSDAGCRDCKALVYGEMGAVCACKLKPSYLYFDPEEAVRIVEEWSKAHPIQTNADKFREVYGFGHQGVGCNDCKIVYGDTWWDAPYEAPKGADDNA